MLVRGKIAAPRAAPKPSASSKRGFSTFIEPGRRPVIVSAARTPIGSIQGAFANLTAPQLGGVAIRGALERATGLSGSDVQEVIMGNVVSAGIGQAPARQACLAAGLPHSTVCTTVNKMCASGLKSVMYAAQGIIMGEARCIIAGGMESMTNAPHLIAKARQGYRYGNGVLEDSLVRDGLSDAYNGKPMGWCAEETARKYGITREEQDKFCIRSYTRAKESTEQGRFKAEIIPVSLPGKGKNAPPVQVAQDEEYKNIQLEKIPTLRGAFVEKDGTVTAANSSKLSDGAAALVITSEEKAEKAGLKPLARILGFGDAEREPLEFTIAPADAIKKALESAGVRKQDVQFWEINEAFSVVTLINQRLLDLDPDTVNVNGGAVALGHPIGCSGARILVSLINILNQNNAQIGAVGICNGGGGASAMVIERI